MSRSKRNAALQACIVTVFSFEFATHVCSPMTNYFLDYLHSLMK